MKKRGIKSLALVFAAVILLGQAVSFTKPVTALAALKCKTGKVGERYIGGPWKYGAENDKNLEINGSVSGLPEGISASTLYESHDHAWAIVFKGTPTKAGTYTFSVNMTLTKNDDSTENITERYTIVIEEADKKDDDDDDDDSSSGMSYEEEQREAAKHFAPDSSTMTAEQSIGWSYVSREAPAVTSSTGGATAVGAYQGSMCRLAFQLAAPGYNLGHTYNMTLNGTGGNISMKVPNDLAKSGRKFAVAFVGASVGNGGYISTVPMGVDANGNIVFNPALLGITPDSNVAMAIMYLD